MSRDKISTRNKILSAALKLLVDGKGDGVRMGDIAKMAGISRQALYLHFPTRAQLLIATTMYLDELNQTDELLAASRNAKIGPERLDAYIEAWGSYIPKIYGIAKALLAMKDNDEAAALAWHNRMQAMREGCEAAVTQIKNDGLLSKDYSSDDATDILWTMLSVRNWEQLTTECGWSQKKYIAEQKILARKILIESAGG